MDSPNIILIVVDTLRYDYAKPLENALTKLGFIPYKNAIAPAPWTIPSHASIFTGVYPIFHGAHETKNKKNPDITLEDISGFTIQSNLSSLGYETYLLSANPYITPIFGLKEFDHFYDTYSGKYSIFLSEDEQEYIDNLKVGSNNRLISQLFHEGKYKLLLKSAFGLVLWNLNLVKGWPFDMGAYKTTKIIRKILNTTDFSIPHFFFINMMEVHEPYSKKENPQNIIRDFKRNLLRDELNIEQIRTWKEIYPEEVIYVTERILEIFGELKRNNVFDDSLIIVTSDHGQLLGEHGRFGHGVFLYDELLRVPLLIKYPSGQTIDHETMANSWISLTKLKQLILKVIENSMDSDYFLYSRTAFAESYGIQDYIGSPVDDVEYYNIQKLEKYRIALYYGNFKGIFNVEKWKFEKVISYDPDEKITEDVIYDMKREIVAFLRGATMAKVPKN